MRTFKVLKVVIIGVFLFFVAVCETLYVDECLRVADTTVESIIFIALLIIIQLGYTIAYNIYKRRLRSKDEK